MATIPLVFNGISPAQAVDSPLLLTYTIPVGGGSVNLPLWGGGAPNAVIDWGDGSPTVSATSNGFYSHTFTAGAHQVSILGYVSYIGTPDIYYNRSDTQYLTSVDAWGNGLSSFAGLLTYARNLTSVPTSIPSNIVDADYMFTGANVPSQVQQWDVSHLKTVGAMFRNATIDFDLANWNLSGLDASSNGILGWDSAAGFLTDSTMSKENYSLTLIGMASHGTLPSGQTFDGSSRGYCPSATSARATIVGFGWTVGDGGLQTCSVPVAVTGISPNTGSVVGGTRITISGTGLSGLTSLAMGAYACTNLTIVNDTSAYCDTTANNGDPVSYSVYVNGSVTGLSYQYNENSGGGGGTTLTADQTSVSIGNSVSFTTNETGSNMSALFFNGAIPAAVGGNEWFGDVTHTPNPFGWSLFPVCTTGTLTYRVYDSPVAGSHPLWTDSYAASVDVTWVGDESACGGSNTISAGSSTLTYGNSVVINTSVEMGDEVAFFVDGAYAFGGPYEGPIADLPWWVFGECNDVTVTIRVYDTAPGLSPKTWSDAYADSVDIEVLGDASACSNGGGGHSGGGGGGNSAPSKPSVNDVNVTKSSGSLHIQANYTGTYLNAPTYYRVTVSPGGNSCDTNSLFGSCDILGLNPNIDYTVTIVAINSLGSSASLVLPTKFRLSGSSSFKMLGSKTISQFAGDSAKLTATFKASIKKYLKAHPTLHVFTCTGYIAGKAVTKLQKKLALARANAVCGYIHLLRPTDAVTTIGKTPGLKFLAANRKVIIRAYGS